MEEEEGEEDEEEEQLGAGWGAKKRAYYDADEVTQLSDHSLQEVFVLSRHQDRLRFKLSTGRAL